MLQVAKMADISIRNTLLSNVRLVGGGSLLQGLSERLERSLGRLISSKAAKPKVFAAGDRRYSCWLGRSSPRAQVPDSDLLVSDIHALAMLGRWCTDGKSLRVQEAIP